MGEYNYAYELIKTFPKTIDDVAAEIDLFFESGLPENRLNASRYSVGMQRLFSTIDPLEIVKDSFLRELGEYLPALSYITIRLQPSDKIIRDDLGAMLTMAKRQCQMYLQVQDRGKAHSSTELSPMAQIIYLNQAHNDN